MPVTLLALAALAPLARGAAETPRILIVPLTPLKKDGPKPNSTIGNRLAQEFDQDGRTSSIVWGISDPVFRAAALDGKLGNNVPDLPTRDQALDVARRLGAPYVLVYRSQFKGDLIEANAELLSEGRAVWKDSKSMSAKNEQDALSSIARTWVVLMTTGPLKSLAPKVQTSTPTATEGQQPIVVAQPTAPSTVPTGPSLESRVATLVKEGHAEAARALARDAVDASPLAPEPRGVLIRLLDAQGSPELAADEARRAADLIGTPELRADAVRRLVAIGRMADAREQLNEMRARAPEDKSTRRLAAEIALIADDVATALEEADALLKAGDDPEAHLLRGLARARLGGADGAAADAKAWAAGSKDDALARGMTFATQILGACAERAADAFPTIMQKAVVQPKAAVVHDELDEFARQAQARAAFWAALPAPTPRTAYDSWALAHRLMSLVAADLNDFLGGNQDALTSARIDLGEAKRAMKTAKG